MALVNQKSKQIREQNRQAQNFHSFYSRKKQRQNRRHEIKDAADVPNFHRIFMHVQNVVLVYFSLNSIGKQTESKVCRNDYSYYQK